MLQGHELSEVQVLEVEKYVIQLKQRSLLQANSFGKPLLMQFNVNLY